MIKRDLYFSDAESLYVIEQKTINEISAQLKISEKTVRLWKQEGNWAEKRRKFLQNKHLFHEELYEFSRKIMKSIMNDLDSGVDVDTGRFYALVRVLPMISKIKQYEDTLSKKLEKQAAKSIPEDVIKLIEKQIFGINNEVPKNEEE